jgi:hypothetical protein
MRDSLATMARTMVPGGIPEGDGGDVGRAMIEIAARLAEHSTERLDRTPLRDKLVFLEMLDIVAAPPRAATVPVVFTLADKRDRPVFAPARVQLSADGADGEEVTFETYGGIDLTPARLTRLIAADPGTDRIELAPAAVTETLEQPPPPGEYQLASAVEAGARLLQLEQAAGIEPGDLLRVAGSVSRVAAVEGEIVALLDPVEAPAAARAPVEKILRLEAFALRDMHEHVAYFGHKDLLKLDGPSEILLHLEPAGLAGRLAQLDLRFEIWGTMKATGATEPDWHDLALVSSAGSALRLIKSWEGPVEETEIGEHKNRWIRVSLRTPIPGRGEPDTRASSVELEVGSKRPPRDPDALGSRSIADALYNAQPLATSTAFLPFGPEPQRFDTFAIAAPEALSKKGAKVTLDLQLSDATPEALAFPLNATDRAYGIGRDGRLQGIDLTTAPALGWTQIATSTSGTGVGPRLASRRPLYAMDLASGQLRDLVFAAGKDGRLRLGKVETGSTAQPLVEWTDLPRAPGQPDFQDFVLWPAPAPPFALLLAADETGLYRRTVSLLGVPEPDWHPVPSTGTASFAKPAMLVVARGVAAPPRLVLIQNDGTIVRGVVANDGSAVAWSPVAPPLVVKAGIRPAAVIDESTSTPVLAVAAVNSLGALSLLRQGGGVDTLPAPANFAAIGKPATILCSPGVVEPGSNQPLVVVFGEDGFVVWPHRDRADTYLLPGAVDPGGMRAALLRPPAGPSQLPALLLNTSKELLQYAPLERSSRDVVVTRHDLVWGPGLATADFIMLDLPVPVTVPVVPPLIAFPGPLLTYPMALGSLAAVSGYRFFEDQTTGGPKTGTAVGLSTNQFDIMSGDTDTYSPNDVLLIDGVVLSEVLTFTVPATVTLKQSVVQAGVGCTYAKMTLVGSGTVLPEDLGTLAQIGASPQPQPDEVAVGFPAPADPPVQGAVQPSAGPSPWLLLLEKWAVHPVPPPPPSPPAPAPPQPQLLGKVKVGTWKPTPLPRSNEKPELSWEYFDGKGWRRLAVSDGTANFAHGGLIVFTVPADLQPVEIAGHEDYWIRARLEGGDYGAASYVVDTSVPNQQKITVDRSRLNPPEMLSIEVDYDLALPAAPQTVLTLNNLDLIDQTQAAAADGAVFSLFEGIDEHVGEVDLDGWRSLYLGFSKPPGVSVLSLYADAIDRDLPPRSLEAHVLTATRWAKVIPEDETGGLTRPGRLQLILNAAPAQRSLFGRDGWWIRLRPAVPDPDWAPHLRGLFVNAVPAEQGKSVVQELLGSSLGEPDQQYRLAEIPVLPGSLELRVRESLSEEEKAALAEATGDPLAVIVMPDIEGEWVRWRRVDSFVDHDGDARVYRLDASRGELRFGNGREGKIPPAGRDSIRAIAYQAGGGAVGNVPAWSVANLKSAVEAVETIFNPVDAGGGAEGPRAEQIAAAGPARLRHAGQALSPADVEALASASAPDVAQVRCLSGRGCSIDLAVAIRSAGERCPVPSRARREGIAKGLLEAGWGALGEEAIRVHPPAYVAVLVRAALIAERSDGVAAVNKAAREALLAFLHPLDGGPRGEGWRFGQRVWRSDLQRLLAGVPGIDRVAELSVEARDPGVSLDALPPDSLIYTGEAELALEVLPPGGAA